ADVEHARPERHRDAEPGEDERYGEDHGLRQQPTRPGEGLGPVYKERPAEQGVVGGGDGVPRGGEHVPGPCEEVAGRLLHPGVGAGDEDGAEHERDDDGEQGDEPAAGQDVTHDLCGAAGRPLRGDLLLRGRGLGDDVARVLLLVPDLLLAHGASSLMSSAAARAVRCSADWTRASSSGTPAIMRPRTSRSVSPGTTPTTRPRYITAIRSAS